MKSSLSSNRQFKFGLFVYEYILVRQERKTLSLTVTPKLKIIVKCPYSIEDSRVETFLRKKWLWLEGKLKFFRKYHRKKYQKEYVSGESFLYLGRQYKLVVKMGESDKVALLRGKFLITTSEPAREGIYNKYLVKKWFAHRALEVFRKRLSLVLVKFDSVEKPGLVVKKMVRRWGSCVNKNKIILNSALIHASIDCIDYVITHELCHLKYKKHDKLFFKLLNKKIPGWKKIKEKLEFKYS